MKKLIASIMMISFTAGSAFANSFPPPQSKTLPQWQNQQYQPHQSYNAYPYSSSQATLKGFVYIVPAGSQFPAVTTIELNSGNLLLGQAVNLNLGQDFYYDNKLVAPAGSVVNGSVVHLKKASFAGRNGQLQVRFTSITTPYGQMIPISGQIKTTDSTGILKGGTAMDTTKDYAKDLTIGAAGGAVGGLVMGAVSDGSVGKGAALGTAIGAGIGLGKSVIDKGKNVVIPANSSISIELTQPVTINSGQTYQY